MTIYEDVNRYIILGIQMHTHKGTLTNEDIQISITQGNESV